MNVRLEGIGAKMSGQREEVVKLDAREEQSLSESQSIELAREYVSQAVSVLNKLGPRYEKISWVLEDALIYFNLDNEQDVSLTPAEISPQPLVRSVDGEKRPTDVSAKTASIKS